MQKLSMVASSCRMFPARLCSPAETSQPCPVLYLIRWGSWLTWSFVPVHQVTYLTPGFLYLPVISPVSLFASSLHCPPAMVPGVKLWRKRHKIMWFSGLFGSAFHIINNLWSLLSCLYRGQTKNYFTQFFNNFFLSQYEGWQWTCFQTINLTQEFHFLLDVVSQSTGFILIQEA